MAELTRTGGKRTVFFSSPLRDSDRETGEDEKQPHHSSSAHRDLVIHGLYPALKG